MTHFSCLQPQVMCIYNLLDDAIKRLTLDFSSISNYNIKENLSNKGTLSESF